MALRLDTRLALMKLNTDHFIEEFFANVREELNRAITKHPMFPDRLGVDVESMQYALQWMRFSNDDNDGADSSAHTVFSEEYFEFQESASKGEITKAYEELIHAATTLLRTAIHLEEYIK